MKKIEDIYSVAKELSQLSINPLLQSEMQRLINLRPNFQTNPNPTAKQVGLSIDKIIDFFSNAQTILWSDEHFKVAETLGLSSLIGEKGKEHLLNIKTQINSNPSIGPSLIQSLIEEFNTLRDKPLQITNLLQPFELAPNFNSINENEGIIEIVFDGKVSIEDFKEARDQMNDWFLIIEGYAKLLNVTREDFEIIGITKSSPTKFKIKTKIKNVGLVLGVITALLTIQKMYLENQLMVEQLKSKNLVSDSASQIKFIEAAETHIREQIKTELEKVAEEKMKEYNIPDGNGDIKNNLTKGIENQYNFIVNGGTVNIHVIDNQVQQDVETLQKAKDELIQIKMTYENQKKITGSKNDNDTIQ